MKHIKQNKKNQYAVHLKLIKYCMSISIKMEKSGECF